MNGGGHVRRAVFLSDTTGQFEDQLADVKKKFLVSLIPDNTVLYVTDKNARNWSFRYYLENATDRLRRLSHGSLTLVDIAALSQPVTLAKDEWIQAQRALDAAIDQLEARLGGHAAANGNISLTPAGSAAPPPR